MAIILIGEHQDVENWTQNVVNVHTVIRDDLLGFAFEKWMKVLKATMRRYQNVVGHVMGKMI